MASIKKQVRKQHVGRQASDHSKGPEGFQGADQALQGAGAQVRQGAGGHVH